jgi:hypothetical protein
MGSAIPPVRQLVFRVSMATVGAQALLREMRKSETMTLSNPRAEEYRLIVVSGLESRSMERRAGPPED